MGRIKLYLISVLMGIGLLTLSIWGYRSQNKDYPFEYTECRMGIPVVRLDDFLEHIQHVIKENGQDADILYNGVQVPLVKGACAEGKSGTLFISHSMKGDDQGILSSSDGSLIYWSDADEVTVLSEDTYYCYDVVFSGLPIISINTTNSIEPGEVDYYDDPDTYVFETYVSYQGIMRLFNPDVNVDSMTITESFLEYHEKGATSANYKKKSYSFNMYDRTGKDNDIALLGMRADNSWKLNSLLSDDTRMREYVAAKIWEGFDDTNVISEKGPREEYVELILDNIYMGLYALVEPVDKKSAKLGADDYLYKTVTVNKPPLNENIQQSIDNGWKVAGSVRLRYPEYITDYEKAWDPMLSYIQTFYELEGLSDFSDADRSWVSERLTSKISIPNACDRYIFNMVVSASDNEFKNVYFAAKHEGDRYVMYQYPWDLDLTFGNVYSYQGKHSCTINDDVTVEYGEVSAAFPLYLQDEEVVDYTLARWEEVRASFCSYDSIMNLFKTAQDRLISSGAWDREKAAWGSDEDLSQLEDYISRRLEWLGGYFEEKRIE